MMDRRGAGEEDVALEAVEVLSLVPVRAVTLNTLRRKQLL